MRDWKDWRRLLPLAVLALMLAAGWAAPFLAPYPPNRQYREFTRLAPAEVAFGTEEGGWTLRPHVRSPASRRLVPVRLFVRGQPYRWMGMTWRTRLFGAGHRGERVFLLGTDRLGRDLFSRLLHGTWTSLTIGFGGVGAAALLGVLAGALAGYLAGITDSLVMRAADLIFALPALFLVMGIRALYPAQLSASASWWMIVIAFALVGWASLARVIRGQVLSLKRREFVLWAQASGASHWWVLRRHILPFTFNTLAVQCMAMMPAFILGEATLSFLGVGVQAPHPSWGNMLSEAASIPVLANRPWTLAPGVLLVVTVLCFNLVADRLKGVERERQYW